MAQSTDPERLSNEQDSKGDAWISLGGGNGLDFASSLMGGWEWEQRAQVEERDGGREQLKLEDIGGGNKAT